MYTSLQRYLVDVVGGRLFTKIIEIEFSQPVNDGDLVITLRPSNNMEALVLGSVTVDEGYDDTCFKCHVGKYQYCYHCPVGWSEYAQPIVVNAIIMPYQEARLYAWTAPNAELPARLVLKLWLAEVPAEALDISLVRTLEKLGLPVFVL